MLKEPLVREYLNDIIEDENLVIVQCLLDGTNTDEEIAEKTNIKLNIVRKILYKLYDSGLASYKRSKDPETQWYTYAWKFDSETIVNHIEDKYKEHIDKLKVLLDFEENTMFFTCETKHQRFTFDEASENGFICPECGEEIKFEENNSIIKRIKEEITNYETNYNALKMKNAK
ncbi:transcription factor E [Methanobrevibacter filiformis]|uniref:Transcription factor E n=1 Tax=Methanobrevibacter filiformis TaxID=55758 RepID=A0A166A0Q7_9EURY|nr:transcription factor E [Methanobrevibacter filiformis]KZX11418.1 transcription initiation factor E subunit alpha [Methanobrevibacter filiformis]